VFGINDPALGANEKMVIPGCGKALIMDAKTGAITPVTQIGGGNETWFNKGDNRYYVTGADVTTGLNLSLPRFNGHVVNVCYAASCKCRSYSAGLT
jgi:hypothetical protein